MSAATLSIVPAPAFDLADQVEQYIDTIDLIHALSTFHHPEGAPVIADLEVSKTDIRERIYRHIVRFGNEAVNPNMRVLPAGPWCVSVHLDEPGHAIYLLSNPTK